MIRFSEWLDIQEARFKGFKRMFKQKFPDMPSYVLDDLYNTRAGFSMKSVSSSPGGSSPWGERPDLNINNPHLPSALLNLVAMDDIEWSKQPEVLDLQTSIQGEGVTPECFDDKTKWRFIHRRFGFREHKAIPKDSFRMGKQKEIMQQRGEGSNEPVIVLHTKQGLLDLLEGWHRTMNYLVTGAPEDQLEMLKNSDVVQGLDFTQWKPVKIMAYIGRGPEIRSMLQGTAEYVPSGASGTGDWVPQNPS